MASVAYDIAASPKFPLMAPLQFDPMAGNLVFQLRVSTDGPPATGTGMVPLPGEKVPFLLPGTQLSPPTRAQKPPLFGGSYGSLPVAGACPKSTVALTPTQQSLSSFTYHGAESERFPEPMPAGRFMGRGV